MMVAAAYGSLRVAMQARQATAESLARAERYRAEIAGSSTGDASLAVSNAVGGIAAQTLFLAIADLLHKRANLEHAAAEPANLFQAVMLIVLLDELLLLLLQQLVLLMPQMLESMSQLQLPRML